jgi:polyhydroxybutyrate depolymerase
MKTGTNRRAAAFVALLTWSIAITGCATARPRACSPADAKPGAALTCGVPGFERRPYDIHLPADYVAARPVPVVLAIHGGGGNSRAAARTACPGGDIAYFRALLGALSRWVAVDPRRVYATGLSNGGAMSHRLACQMADRIAAIATLGGENQYATAATCAPRRPVPVLDIHGTRDPCWPYEGGTAACAQRDGMSKISVEASMRIWAAINGCGSAQAAQPMASEDGIKTERVRWAGCRAETELIRTVGGGHVWPGGWPYLREGIIGPMVRGWSANRVILDFFRRNPMRK